MIKIITVIVFLLFLTTGCMPIDLDYPDLTIDSSQDKFPYFIRMDNTCDIYRYVGLEDIDSEFETKNWNHYLIETTKDNVSLMKQDPCFKEVFTPKEFKKFVEQLDPELQNKVLKVIEELDIEKTLKYVDVTSKENIDEIISDYQLFVDPDSPAVQELAKTISTKKQAYEEAVSWMWVSEETLNNQAELWLSPEEFLTQTPYFSTNPVQGTIASDCSEQANTLVSLMRAIGVSSKEVRVVLGQVDFGGTIGGHAWVEVYEDGEWFALEATSGSYYDDAQQKYYYSPGISYNYYKFFEYPVVEKWYSYNDVYFYDIEKNKGYAPSSWV